MAKPSRRISKEEKIPIEFKTMNPDAELRPELKVKIQKWILSFYHLDPRYKILTFFNLVASEGADNVTDDSVEEHSISIRESTKPTPTPTGSNSNGGSNRMSSGSGGSSPKPGKKSPNARDTYRVNANLMSRPSARNIKPQTLSLLSSLFNATSILTVWRPCSNDAMRKMMEGTGVGKGLDIKGKSAKKGSLSAFVPFLQIFHNEHKNEIQPIQECAEMRIYYKSIELRDYVYGILQNHLKEGPAKKKKETEMLNDDESGDLLAPLSKMSIVKTLGGEEAVDEAMIAADIAAAAKTNGDEYAAQDMEIAMGGAKPADHNGIISDGEEADEYLDRLPPHKDPYSPSYLPDSTKLKKIKKFAKTGYYGIECSQRLFWYATVNDADITRVGTGTETGRPSLPGFQDANLKTLKIAQAQLPKPSPMPVVVLPKSMEEVKKELENKREEAKEESDENDNVHPLGGCLDPRHLVMAYEEQGTIKPVVSDFDGFLLGWRREALWFGCNLPRDQEELMIWAVQNIEQILDEQTVDPTNSDTWTIRWLDVLKKAAAEGKQIDVPEYGFGDPKSTSIMEHASLKLKSTGAVRHGSECFNYQFPQEIDDMFLLISDTLKPVPWKYVNVKDLQTILSKKIAEGFVFPLNPKWILCDPGWKKIYDDLMASEALYADLSKDVWFPHHTGIRERIESIHARHPNGFQRCTDRNRAKSSSERTKAASSGRRQSVANLLRETLDEGGLELTGNAYADLAQLELDDFVGRNSALPGKKDSDIRSDIMAARAGLTIAELEDEDHSSSEARSGGGVQWRNQSKQPYEKRPSAKSHSSVGSSTSDRGANNHNYSAKSSSTKSGRTGIGGFKKAGQSIRRLVVAKKSRSRPTSNLTAFEEGDQETVPKSPYRSKLSGSLKKYYDIPESIQDDEEEDEEESTAMSKLPPNEKMISSKTMNQVPRRHFSKWNKIRKTVKAKEKEAKEKEASEKEAKERGRRP